MKKLLAKRGGFTVLELLIVVVIIGILAVLIIPNLLSGPAKVRDAQRKHDLLNIKTALETYYNTNNSYPTAGGASCTPSVASCLSNALTTGPTPYMKIVPNDPLTGRNYTYAPTPSSCTPGACTSYTLTATLENTHDSQAVNGIYTVNSAN